MMKILDGDVVREDRRRRTRRLAEGLAIHRLLRTDPARSRSIAGVTS